jgi:hypothetical protein
MIESIDYSTNEGESPTTHALSVVPRLPDAPSKPRATHRPSHIRVARGSSPLARCVN